MNNKDNLGSAIMNIQCDVENCTLTGAAAEMSYKQGHRDARHAALDLVNEFAAQAEQGQSAGSARQGGITSPEDIYVAGFMASSEGFNAEYGCSDPWASEYFVKGMREYLAAAIASQSQAAQPTGPLPPSRIIEIRNEAAKRYQSLDDVSDSGIFEFARAIERAAIAAHIAGTSQATKAQADEELAAKLNAAVDAEYPVPDSPHTSVLQRAVDNRAAMWRGISAARKILAPVAKEAPQPEGFALVPLRMTAAMRRVTDEEGWQWEDLLAAAESITEDQYNDIASGSVGPEGST